VSLRGFLLQPRLHLRLLLTTVAEPPATKPLLPLSKQVAHAPPAARSPACTARSLQHAQRSTGQRNPTESSTPLGFILARPTGLPAYCSACASAYAPPAARSPECTARSLQDVNKSIGARNPAESTALSAPLMELRTCDSDCARPACHLPCPQSCPHLH
jgi:hypothetical protein